MLTPQQLKIAKIAKQYGLEEFAPNLVLENFITVDPAMLELKRKVGLLCSSKYNILVTGETGCGKELISRALHHGRSGQFIAVNCSAMPAELFESLLFGHIRGSFTGAIADHNGAIRAAENGTLFLDEIGDLPPYLQPKLLRVLENGCYTPVGSNKEVELRCRFVSATSQDKSKIREDLYWRLAEVKLEIKPLRNRHCDLIPIANNIATALDLDHRLKQSIPALINNHLDIDWSGNVRQLKQLLIERDIAWRLMDK